MTPTQEPQMPILQDRKFDFSTGRLVNRASGETIPDDEPVFILRARDRHALKAVQFYAGMVEVEHHWRATQETVEAFQRFADEHPDRMKEPGITRAFNLSSGDAEDAG